MSFVGTEFWILRNSVPSEFIDARAQGAVISGNIVNLSRQTTGNLEKINQLDREGNYAEATNLTLKTIQDSQEIRSQAVELSNQVAKMTESLSGINSFEARQAALEAIADRLALISKLINYSDYLNQLLTELRARFSGQPGNHKVSGIISEINAEGTAINSFNDQATQAMQKFDAIVNGK